MYRTHTCGELRTEHLGETVTIAGWVQTVRDKGNLIWVDVRDRYGITQVVAETGTSHAASMDALKTLSREFVVQIEGVVTERKAANSNLSTGEIEVAVSKVTVLNSSEVPPFAIEDETDGGDELRMKFRYLDLRRTPLQKKLMLRHRVALETRKYMDSMGFLEVETPCLIKSTPEGARDFVVPSRMNPGEFYALPQSPQTFKQLLMVSGYDRYYQIVKCFRDEDLRADRQPEFTQIDCEMAFVEREDILETFEGLVKHLFKTCCDVVFTQHFPHMSYDNAMERYGCDKPDIRFGMEFLSLNNIVKGKGFNVFDSAELVIGINAKGCANFTRKQIDELTEWVKRPQVGAKGLVYCRCADDGSYKSSVDKFYNQDQLGDWAKAIDAEQGDLIFVLSGKTNEVRRQMSELRLHLGNLLGLRKPNEFKPLWVLDFPLLEWNEESKRFFAMHHPFTSPNHNDISKMDSAPAEVKANAYDLVVNGVEIGGGSIRIHDRTLQEKMFKLLGFTKEEAEKQFGFLLNAFRYGAPPHGGIAFGFDRLVATMGGSESIRDFIAFPKNNSGRDTMIDTPSTLDNAQLKELYIRTEVPEQK